MIESIRSKISLWIKRGSPEDPRQKVKIRMGTQIRIADKKTTTISKNTKTEHENIFKRREKAQHREEKKYKLKRLIKITGERRLKRYQDWTKYYR